MQPPPPLAASGPRPESSELIADPPVARPQITICFFKFQSVGGENEEMSSTTEIRLKKICVDLLFFQNIYLLTELALEKKKKKMRNVWFFWRFIRFRSNSNIVAFKQQIFPNVENFLLKIPHVECVTQSFLNSFLFFSAILHNTAV